METNEQEGGAVVLTLSKAEALVLFEWVHVLEDKDELFVDQAEQRLLWDISAGLERVLIEPFRPDYTALLDEARSQVRDRAI